MHWKALFNSPLSAATSALGTLALVIPLATTLAGVVTTKEGLQYEGRLGKIATIGENPLQANAQAGEVTVTKIVLIDDELRRTYISSNNVQHRWGERSLVSKPLQGQWRRYQ